MKPTKDGFVLSTGKEIYAYGNVIGISNVDEGDEFAIKYGYDGTIYYCDESLNTDELTNGELIEIAYYMIEQWNHVIFNLLTRNKNA